MIFKHRFVDYIPDNMDANTIYISIEYSTAIHLCACGCGNEVVTPLSPTDWEMTFNGKTVSFYPSIGNWNFDCRSHYWIRRNEILMVPKWSKKEIKENREKDKREKEDFYFESQQVDTTQQPKKNRGKKKWLLFRSKFK
jgi:hypothetical protein